MECKWCLFCPCKKTVKLVNCITFSVVRWFENYTKSTVRKWIFELLHCALQNERPKMKWKCLDFDVDPSSLPMTERADSLTRCTIIFLVLSQRTSQKSTGSKMHQTTARIEQWYSCRSAHSAWNLIIFKLDRSIAPPHFQCTYIPLSLRCP